MKKNFLTIFLLLGTIFLVLLAVKFGNLNLLKEEADQKIQETDSEAETRKFFLAKLPIEADDFHIGYAPQFSEQVVVAVWGESRAEFLEKKVNALEFIKAYGIKDVCSLNLEFVPIVNSVKSEVTEPDIVVEGCSSSSTP